LLRSRNKRARAREMAIGIRHQRRVPLAAVETRVGPPVRDSGVGHRQRRPNPLPGRVEETLAYGLPLILPGVFLLVMIRNVEQCAAVAPSGRDAISVARGQSQLAERIRLTARLWKFSGCTGSKKGSDRDATSPARTLPFAPRRPPAVNAPSNTQAVTPATVRVHRRTVQLLRWRRHHQARPDPALRWSVGDVSVTKPGGVQSV